MQVLKTPESSLVPIHEYPYSPKFLDLDDQEGGKLRMHYVDEGPRDGKPVVMIHGNPTWSYEWRNVIPHIVEAGYRAIAIDLIGMGRSDKPAAMKDYTIARHVEWVRQALHECLNLQDAVLVLHDWGGIIGLRVLAADTDRYSHTVFSNTSMPVLDPANPPVMKKNKGTRLLRIFQLKVKFTKNWKFWNTIRKTCVRPVSEETVRGYAQPYPDKAHFVGHRQFTQMLPTKPDNPMLPDNWEAMQVLKSYDKPLLCLFSDKDIVAPRGYKSIRPRIPGAARHEPVILENASHFLTEDAPDEYAAALLDWLRDTGGVAAGGEGAG